VNACGFVCEMLPCLFFILQRIKNATRNSRVATAIGTTIAMTSILLPILFSGSQVEASLSHRFALLPVLALEQHYHNWLGGEKACGNCTCFVPVVGVNWIK
jgi:hypothetical protein